MEKPRGFPPRHVIDEGTPMGTSRYDSRFSEVGSREYEESRALHIIADLVRDYPGIDSVSLRGAISEVLRQVAIDLGNGQPVPVGLRRGVLRLADLLRQEMQPSGD
jgi:hypothetical protein